MEMRRAILIHRFIEAYRNTVKIKVRPAASDRHGEPAVQDTQCLTSFKKLYIDNESFLTAAKLTPKTDIRSDEVDELEAISKPLQHLLGTDAFGTMAKSLFCCR